MATTHTTCLICFGRFAYADTDGICHACRAKLLPRYIPSVLGENRRIRSLYLDGSYTCPWCGAAAGLVDRPNDPKPCPNPWCDAHPTMPADAVLARRREARLRAEESARRKRNHELAMEASRRYHAQRDAEISDAREAGFCVQCFVRSGNRKRIRHRSADYHATR